MGRELKKKMKQVLVGKAPGHVLTWLGEHGAGPVMRPAVWSTGKAEKRGKELTCVFPHVNRYRDG